MQHKLLIRDGNKGLLIFFLGWSCDPESVKKFTPAGWDLLLLYDYRNLELPKNFDTIVAPYEKCSVIAHSFGVWVAGYFMGSMPKLTSAVAVCGTLLPVNDKFGISTRIFDFTLSAIQKGGIGEFNKRMCGSDIDSFTPSALDFEDQFDDLVALGSYFREFPINMDIQKWSSAVVCSKDEIFPPDNVANFWIENDVEIMAFRNKSHFPFDGNFGTIISHLLE